MELRTLEYFIAIAETGSLTAAAADLHMTQPSLSRQMAELERELGVTLLERKSRGVRLTQAGRRLRRHAEAILERTEQARHDIQDFSSQRLGDVYIGGAEGETVRLLARAAQSFRREHPESIIHFTSGCDQDIEKRLDDGTVDLVYFAPSTVVRKYETIAIPVREPWMLYTLADNPLARKQRIELTDLLDEPLIVPRMAIKRNVPDNPLATWLGSALRSLNIVADFNLPFMGYRFVQEGLGSMITWNYELFTPEDGSIRKIPLHPAISDEVVLAWRKGTELSPAASAFMKHLVDVLEREEPADPQCHRSRSQPAPRMREQPRERRE